MGKYTTAKFVVAGFGDYGCYVSSRFGDFVSFVSRFYNADPYSDLLNFRKVVKFSYDQDEITANIKKVLGELSVQEDNFDQNFFYVSDNYLFLVASLADDQRGSLPGFIEKIYLENKRVKINLLLNVCDFGNDKFASGAEECLKSLPVDKINNIYLVGRSNAKGEPLLITEDDSIVYLSTFLEIISFAAFSNHDFELVFNKGGSNHSILDRLLVPGIRIVEFPLRELFTEYCSRFVHKVCNYMISSIQDDSFSASPLSLTYPPMVLCNQVTMVDVVPLEFSPLDELLRPFSIILLEVQKSWKEAVDKISRIEQNDHSESAYNDAVEKEIRNRLSEVFADKNFNLQSLLAVIEKSKHDLSLELTELENLADEQISTDFDFARICSDSDLSEMQREILQLKPDFKTSSLIFITYLCFMVAIPALLGAFSTQSDLFTLAGLAVFSLVHFVVILYFFLKGRNAFEEMRENLGKKLAAEVESINAQMSARLEKIKKRLVAEKKRDLRKHQLGFYEKLETKLKNICSSELLSDWFDNSVVGQLANSSKWRLVCNSDLLGKFERTLPENFADWDKLDLDLAELGVFKFNLGENYFYEKITTHLMNKITEMLRYDIQSSILELSRDSSSKHKVGETVIPDALLASFDLRDDFPVEFVADRFGGVNCKLIPESYPFLLAKNSLSSKSHKDYILLKSFLPGRLALLSLLQLKNDSICWEEL